MLAAPDENHQEMAEIEQQIEKRQEQLSQTSSNNKKGKNVKRQKLT